MENLTFILPVTEKEKAMFEGWTAMIIPVSEAEIAELRGSIPGVHEFLLMNSKGLSILKQIHETASDKGGHITKTLDMLIEPSRVCVGLQDGVRRLIGKAFFVSRPGGKKKARMQ